MTINSAPEIISAGSRVEILVQGQPNHALHTVVLAVRGCTAVLDCALPVEFGAILRMETDSHLMLAEVVSPLEGTAGVTVEIAHAIDKHYIAEIRKLWFD